MLSPYILARIATRSGGAFWRHRIAWFTTAVVVSAFGVYQLTYARASLPTSTAASATGGDCADTMIAAATVLDDDMARATYACLSSDMRTLSEDDFVAGMRQADMQGGVPSRIGDKRTVDGGWIVFFTIDQRGETSGYKIYLDTQGKVLRIA
jgi:hypothetical protein